MRLTVFSPAAPAALRSSCFISENCTSIGSARSVATRSVSPSALLMLRERSSEPSASRPASLHAPHVIDLECLPMMGTRRDVLWL